MECKHRNCTIELYTTQIAEFEVNDGIATFGSGDEPFGRQWAKVNCRDCGLIRTYKKYPAWLKSYVKANMILLDAQRGD